RARAGRFHPALEMPQVSLLASGDMDRLVAQPAAEALPTSAPRELGLPWALAPSRPTIDVHVACDRYPTGTATCHAAVVAPLRVTPALAGIDTQTELFGCTKRLTFEVEICISNKSLPVLVMLRYSLSSIAGQFAAGGWAVPSYCPVRTAISTRLYHA